jgi:hypothetical protein
MDDVLIEPKSRVHSWMSGLSGREMARIRRAVVDSSETEAVGEEDGFIGRRKHGTTSMP